jgi:hypothetical protein
MNIDDERGPIALDRTTLSIPYFIGIFWRKTGCPLFRKMRWKRHQPAARGLSLP